jgi:hypothetical protein
MCQEAVRRLCNPSESCHVRKVARLLARPLSGKRAGFFLVDIDSAEEIHELFGPEILANFKLEVHAVTPLDKIGKIFQRWATEGR